MGSTRPESLIAGLEDAERELAQHRAEEEEVARELEETERRLTENRQRTVDALEEASRRLDEIEARAMAAEERAKRAEQLAEVKVEEEQRADRLREMLDRLAEAEERANEAEQRARDAVARVAEPMPEIDPDAIVKAANERESATAAPEPQAPAPAPEPVDSGPEAFLPPQDEPPVPTVVSPPEDRPGDEAATTLHNSTGEKLEVNTASYEDLRALGLSVTQTGRVLAYRERVGGFDSLEDLDAIPGFPRSFLDELKSHLRI
jgi:DNA uptake protein ComE-like DNA-binding protein